MKISQAIYSSIKLCLIVSSFLMMGTVSQARHIIGGEITYECLGIDTVRNTVTLRFSVLVYRDCYGQGADFDPAFTFGIYYKNGSSWEVFDAQGNVPLSGVRTLDNTTDNPCVTIPSNVCVQEGVYTFTRTLPIRSTNYMIAYQRCCRNNTITNIWRPGEQGAAYTIEITPEAQATCNNSPRFRQFPPIVICVDEPLNFDHGAEDAEGDDLVYEFCAPLTAGGQLGANGVPCPAGSCDCVIPSVTNCRPPFRRVDFRSPFYSSTEPLGGNPVVTIDRITGLIEGIPTEQGQFVVGVCVNEYRNGVLMSTLRRDFQFNVTYCEPTVFAELQSDDVIDGKEFVINSCGNSTIEFINESYRVNFINSYHWEFDINGKVDSFNTRDVTVTFPGIGQYTGTMIINRGLDCSDTANITVNVYPDIAADYAFDYDTCIAGPVIFEDLSNSGSGEIEDWNWSFGDGNSSGLTNPEHQFSTPGEKTVKLLVTDINGCQAEIEKDITYFPVPPLIIVDPSTFKGCAPARIDFVNLSVPIDDTYDILWDFGDGNTSSEINPSHIFEEPGIYTIGIEITSPIGCYTSAEFPAWIEVEPSPEAAFDCSPEEFNTFDRTIKLFDRSIGAGSWQWNIGNEAILFDRNPVYELKDTGQISIELIVTHPSGCPDTAYKIIDVVPLVTYHMPNAFSPNGDGRNDLFKGVGVLTGMSDFKMTIWNRWGELMFTTTDPSEGWNGLKMNNGQEAIVGVYVYQIEYVDPRGDKQALKGYATLLR